MTIWELDLAMLWINMWLLIIGQYGEVSVFLQCDVDHTAVSQPAKNGARPRTAVGSVKNFV